MSNRYCMYCKFWNYCVHLSLPFFQKVDSLIFVGYWFSWEQWNHEFKCSTKYRFSKVTYADFAKTMNSNINEYASFPESTKIITHEKKWIHSNRDGPFCTYIKGKLRAKHYYIAFSRKRGFCENKTKIFVKNPQTLIQRILL